ncbi:MAG: molecular chaperone HtpG [Clostridiaceae bacterium]|nr:molecular chaperone HtpG [Clostridiaceae bacterium]
MNEHGTISIAAENMFPIIRKWLYTDRDIFIRELTSNCADAITKLERLVSLGEVSVSEDETYRITVTVDEEAHTIAFEDNGLGMTEDEVKKYINQVAFSGARDFFEQYQTGDKKDDKGAPDTTIIGHFGLGFYSAFIAAKSVTIDTLSYREDATPVKWFSETGTEFAISDGTRATRGSVVTVALDDESDDYAKLYGVRAVLMKYFRYLPIPIYLRRAGDEVKADEKPINATAPLWNKAPKDCTEQEYRDFYREVFPGAQEPLFWVHLNIDYPFRLKGILYFPKLKSEFDTIEGQVKLYCNQVFVADNLKEVIPEYLLLLKGCIDCPDLPLNVSRSMLQNDGTVKKISGHITRKVADRLTDRFKNEREDYEKQWDDVSPFIKYGVLRDEKFYDRMKSALIFKMLDGSYKTVDEYIESLPSVELPPEHDECEECGDEHCEHEHEKHEPAKEKTIYYVSDPRQQAQYIAMFKNRGLEAVILDHVLDNHFITLLERKNEGLRFKRIDADLSELESKDDAPAPDAEGVKSLFAGLVGDTEVSVQKLLGDAPPAVLTLSEEGRRLQEMTRMFGGNAGFDFPAQTKLIVNAAHPLVATLLSMKSAGRDDDANRIAAQVYDLARLAQKPLSADEMTAFIRRSAEIMEIAAK